jgi:hypothetical protein
MWGTKVDSSTTYYGIATLTNMESAGYVDETGTRCCTWKRLKSWYAKNINGQLPPTISSFSMDMSPTTGYVGGRYVKVLGACPMATLLGKSRNIQFVMSGQIVSNVSSSYPGWSGTVTFDLYLTFSNSATSYTYGTDEIYVTLSSITPSQTTYTNIGKEIEINLDTNSVNGSSLDANIEQYTYLLLVAIPRTSGANACTYIGNGSQTLDSQYVNCYSYALDKCLKGNDFQKKSVTRPWVYRISEGVSGATRARTVTGRLAYKGSSSSSYSTIDIGTWTNSSNITDAASKTVWTKCNPYNILNVSDISNYTMRLWFWCGTTNNKQKWYGYYQTRTKSTGALGTTWSSAVNLTGSGDKGTSIIYGNDSQDTPFYSIAFKTCMQSYCGVTCRPE